MKVLIVGAGVIGTVYGAHIAAAGSQVSVLSHGRRTAEVAATGLRAREVLGRGHVNADADVVPNADGKYDIVLVAVRRDQLAPACARLAVLPASADYRLAALEAILSDRGFAVQRVTDMDGWLATMLPSSRAWRRPWPAAEPTPSAWPLTGPRSLSCARPSPGPLPACALTA
jgi:glycerol-3-phosphate dehydrogenase